MRRQDRCSTATAPPAEPRPRPRASPPSPPPSSSAAPARPCAAWRGARSRRPASRWRPPVRSGHLDLSCRGRRGGAEVSGSRQNERLDAAWRERELGHGLPLGELLAFGGRIVAADLRGAGRHGREDEAAVGVRNDADRGAERVAVLGAAPLVGIETLARALAERSGTFDAAGAEAQAPVEHPGRELELLGEL